jgi:hypothetical protein
MRYLIKKCHDGYSEDEIKEFPALATGFTGTNTPDQLSRTQITAQAGHNAGTISQYAM